MLRHPTTATREAVPLIPVHRGRDLWRGRTHETTARALADDFGPAASFPKLSDQAPMARTSRKHPGLLHYLRKIEQPFGDQAV
jgi:hypothetical protein